MWAERHSYRPHYNYRRILNNVNIINSIIKKPGVQSKGYENGKGTQNESCAAHGAARPPGCFLFESSDILKVSHRLIVFLNAKREVVSVEQTAKEEFSLWIHNYTSPHLAL